MSETLKCRDVKQSRDAKMVFMNDQPRSYGGVDGALRVAQRREALIEAGLELMGSAEPELTVRGVCKKAGVAARYFYESFTDRDALMSAVYDTVITDIAVSTQAAVDAAETERGKALAGIANIVRTIANDPRRGRLLFSSALTSPVLAEKRQASTTIFIGLLAANAKTFYRLNDSGHLTLTATFLVGGLAQTLSAWLDGYIDVTEEELVAECAAILLAPALPPS
ncbi:TetR/AcrR family transcriptional regulator [Rhodococcus sp. D-46]|nr:MULTISPECIES: TetR family transcriptional regulator [Rhodococcus]MBT9298635.1 TetR family transcriptional regulator [Rhodococcus sp. GOMB7]NHE63695.1 TetR/AcrR family transcriptional regulator [Rhodococcus sp. D-46]THJ73615.1 TetR/AcrR family transcriptional regulator [Rhodococcus qingshengii]UPU42580.1 TetR family transcriptional regulator [Rhodococcus qingshengii JCM 15477]|eukprot:gene25298-30368_t